MQIQFTLNGKPQILKTDPGKPLLDVIRNELGLTGTKQGCDHEGECGVCTVLLNGKPIRSCLTPAGKIHGQELLTIEGLGSLDHPHPLQSAFMETGAVQCGFCIPGMLLSAKALLEGNHEPSREDIRDSLSGNLCRCTGYQSIVDAVQLAASRIGKNKGTPTDDPLSPKVIGGNSLRVDAWERVSGQTLFAGDIQVPDLHYLTIFRSPHHHARLLSLDIRNALQVPGIVEIVTADHIAGENGLGDYSRDEPVLVPVGGTCTCLGAPIAILVAESPTAGKAGLNAVEAEFQELPTIFTVSEALDQSAPDIYPGGNLLSEAEISWGDIEQIMEQSDIIIDSEHQTSWQEHAALEPETLIGYYDDQEKITVIGGTHQPHWQQQYIAACLNVTLDSVRVIMPPTGGSFGGKQDPWPFLATALALHISRKPVKLAYSRAESFLASPKRHPYRVRIKLGAKKNGTLTGIDARVHANTGGYDGHGQYIVDFALVGCGGPYQYQAVNGRAESIYTNGPKGGQFRGFGTPQSTFALESTLDELAQVLDLDPLNLRMKNALEESSQSFLGYPVPETQGYQETLKTLQPYYKESLKEASEFNQTQPPGSPYRKGVGVAGMWYRFGKSGSLTVQADAEITTAGELVIFCSAPDYGQGSTTAMSQMAAEILAVPREIIQIINADTDRTPDSGIQGASRATYFVGGAVVQASKQLKNTLLETAAELLDCPPSTLNLGKAGISCLSEDNNSLSQIPFITYQELANELDRLNLPTRFTGIFDLTDHFPSSNRPEYLPLFVTGVQAAEVLVNIKTGEVKVPKVSAVHDVGKIINPQDARGQVEGSILMGVGSALMEEYLPGLTSGFGDYYLPTSMDAPDINTILLEVPGLLGPFGVKGLGEAAVLPAAPAIINGISRTIGTRIYQIPATPELVLKAIQKSGNRPNG